MVSHKAIVYYEIAAVFSEKRPRPDETPATNLEGSQLLLYRDYNSTVMQQVAITDRNANDAFMPRRM